MSFFDVESSFSRKDFTISTIKMFYLLESFHIFSYACKNISS